MRAYRHWDEGKQWLRITSDTAEWDEPIINWSEILDLTDGKIYYRNEKDGRTIQGA